MRATFGTIATIASVLLGGSTEAAVGGASSSEAAAAPGGGTPPPAPDAEAAVEVQAIDSVVVTVRPDSRGAFEQPSAVAVVDAENIRRQSPSVLPDLLRDQPGVFVQQTGPGQGAPIVRGLIGSAVLMLVDGVRLNNAFFRPAPNQFFALVDPHNVERIEIVRGPGSSPYGSDALGGVVRVFSPTPRFRGEDWQVRTRALGQVASADRSWLSRLSLAGGKAGVSATGGFTYQQRGDLRGGGDVGRQSPTGFSGYAANAKLAIERARHDAVLGVQYVIEPKTPRYDELVPGFGRAEAPADLFTYEPMRRLMAHGSYRLSSTLAAARTLEVRLSYQRIDDDRRLRDRGGPVEVRERNRGDSAGLGIEAVAALGTRNTLSYGVELAHDRIGSSRVDTEILTGNPQVAPSRYPDGSRMSSVGIYAQDSWAALPRLQLVPGIRLSAFDLDIPAADREVPARLRFADLTGGLGALVRLVPGVNLVANVGRGFRAPNVFDLSSLGNRPGNRFQVPNPDLRPESILGFDTGLKLSWSRLAGELFGFYSSYRDKIEAAPTGDTDAQGRQVVRSINVSRVDLLGAEAALTALLPGRVELSGGLNYTYGRERLAGGGYVPADRIPPLNLRTGLLWRLNDRVWGEGYVRAALRQDRLSERDREDPRIDPDGTPGWTTVNLRVGGELGRYLRALVSLENLFDVRYRDHGSGVYAPGFSAIFTLEAGG